MVGLGIREVSDGSRWKDCMALYYLSIHYIFNFNQECLSVFSVEDLNVSS